jgi:hypothetical protein
MTKKDYKVIAEALNNAEKSATNKAIKSGVYLAFSYLCEILKADNERFSKEKFFDAVYK